MSQPEDRQLSRNDGQKTALTACEAAFKKSVEAEEHAATASAFCAFRAGWYARADATTPSETAWIDVGERLPPLQELVLALNSDGHYVLEMRCSEPSDKHSHWTTHRSDEIECWQFLPDAPPLKARETVAGAHANRHRTDG